MNLFLPSSKSRGREKGATLSGATGVTPRALPGQPAVKAPAVLFLPVSSLLSGSCWDEKLKNNAIMPNSIEKNNLFSPLPLFVLFKPLIPILEEVGPSTQIFSSMVI